MATTVLLCRRPKPIPSQGSGDIGNGDCALAEATKKQRVCLKDGNDEGRRLFTAPAEVGVRYAFRRRAKLLSLLLALFVLLPHRGNAFRSMQGAHRPQSPTFAPKSGSTHQSYRGSMALQPTPFLKSLKLRPVDSKRRPPPLLHQNSYPQWEGDDMRWLSKLQRSARRSLNWRLQPVRNTILLLNVAAFLYQTFSTMDWIRRMYPGAWPNQSISIAWDTLTGSSRPGPMTMDFVHSALFSARQPHRYLTAGFLHGSIFHLAFNMDALCNLPTWLETGIGAPLYLTTYLAAIVAGNLAHTATALTGTLCLGASGGVCGLYGLLYVCLIRMGNQSAAWRVAKGMGILFLIGAFMANVSNAGHAGGFAAGIVLGLVSGPSYRKSYALRRKNSLEVDIYSRDYRIAMGFDKVPSERGTVPVVVLWVAALIALLAQAKIRTSPQLILRGLLHPGSLLMALFPSS